MDYRASMERNEIVNDLNAISRDLEQVAEELRRIKGVGAEYCAEQLIQISQKYNKVRQNLYRL
ncbi:hypothetical protein [Cohnella mopanensis]|uniref:hypothetical protein n=1 Tax=Cohnella mopanensis TaxID=2911966 RepID=UPI001EF922B2|nr:hypothetical protein [Cohnella mopanensis]